ncbi:MAG: hypothetical protein AUG51_17080 [Acidobacteria bacterium 13_1_20CM_3_53_8]|nr:MAG: hypothetical protein AUG51_17080 [Acidobacteria bacterium 13_1_20CM_3_53_8]
MGLTFTFPTNVELDVVTQEYIIETDKFIGEQEMPDTEFQTQKVRWDERDSERGMTAPHAMDSDPRIDKRPGSKTREYEAIPFKESDLIKESELLRSRELGTLGGAINLDRIVTQTARARMDKTKLRAEWCRWQCLGGELEINENGVYVHETFPVQTYEVATSWDNRDEAVPLRDANLVALKFPGTGASAEGAKEYLNRKMLNLLLENANPTDIAGFRSENFRTTTYSLEDLNKILATRGLPILVPYDEGWIDKNGVLQRFIPDGISIVVGKRPANQKVGGFGMTPSLHRTKNGLPAPGYFNFLEVNGQPNMGSVTVDVAALGQAANPNIKNTGGVYGGPFLWYARSVVVKTLLK